MRNFLKISHKMTKLSIQALYSDRSVSMAAISTVVLHRRFRQMRHTGEYGFIDSARHAVYIYFFFLWSLRCLLPVTNSLVNLIYQDITIRQKQISVHPRFRPLIIVFTLSAFTFER